MYFAWKAQYKRYPHLQLQLPVVPARGGAEVALGLYYKTFLSSIELAWAVRQPRPCVRAFCERGALFQMSHLKLQTSHCTLHTPHSTLHIPHFISSHLISSHLRSSHLISAHFMFLIRRLICHLSSS